VSKWSKLTNSTTEELRKYMTYADIDTINSFVNLISFDEEGKEVNIPLKTKVALYKISSSISSDFTVFSKVYKELVEKYKDESAAKLAIKEDEKEKFIEEVNTLRATEAQVTELTKIKLDDLASVCEQRNINLLYGDIAFLQKFILE